MIYENQTGINQSAIARQSKYTLNIKYWWVGFKNGTRHLTGREPEKLFIYLDFGD